MRLAPWMRWECARLRLAVVQAQAEVERLLARGDVFETAPRRLGLGEAEAWLGPANREFSARFERLTVRGHPSELVLGAQTPGGYKTVGDMRDAPDVRQQVGTDAVDVSDRRRPWSCASLWHLALWGSHWLRPCNRPVTQPSRLLEGEAPPLPPPHRLRNGLRCAAVPALLAWLALRASHQWLAGALALLAADCLLSPYRTEPRATHTSRIEGLHAVAVLRSSIRTVRDAVLSADLSDAYWEDRAICELDTDQPLGPATREFFEHWAHLELGAKGPLWRLSRPLLRPSAVLPGYVRVGQRGDAEYCTLPDGDELLLLARRGQDVWIEERWPSIWHCAAWSWGVDVEYASVPTEDEA